MGPLKDYKVLLTGVADRERCLAAVQALGGEVVTAVAKRDLPHVIVTSTWKAEKVKVRLKVWG